MTVDTFTLPSNFTLAYYRFTLQALDPIQLPPNKGTTLRGGFGHTLKKVACSQPVTCDEKCQLGNECPYGYIFETSSSTGNARNIPRPFIIQPPRDNRSKILPGEQFSFGLVLVGYAINYFSHFLGVFRELGWVGLGESRGQYQIVAVDAIMPYTGQVERVYQYDDSRVQLTRLLPKSDHFIQRARALAENKVTIEFLTPTRLKGKGAWILEGPPFFALVNRLLDRVKLLSSFHCGQPFELDFKSTKFQAETVRIVDIDTDFTDWSRPSGRQKKPHGKKNEKQYIKMGGLMGRVTYQGDLAPYLPLLALGELVHVGKGTVFGNGQYQIIKEND